MAQPIVKLSFRDAHGDMNLSPDLSGFLSSCQRSHVLLLIHGYNNTVDQATDAFDRFLTLQRKISGMPLDTGDFAPDTDIVEVFWKGDDWGIASGLYYMHAIPNAIQTAGALAKALIQLCAPGVRSISVVAHSLGTRLAFETLQALSALGSGLKLDHLVLFAAATPTFKLEEGAAPALRSAYDSHVVDQSFSLYSGSDVVLSSLFPIGQTAALDGEGFFPTALGHERWDEPTAPTQDHLKQIENSGANHGDYWSATSERADCQLFAAQKARECLKFTTAAIRYTAQSELASRDTVDEIGIPDRETASRDTLTRLA